MSTTTRAARTSMTVAGQTAVTYGYDNANRLTTITQGTNVVTLGYDDADRRTSVSYPNGNSVTYAYNAASELTSLTFKQGATVIGDLTYTYDLAGNRIKTGGTFARTTIPPALTTTTYNANNQQTVFGANTLGYDLNGNLATVTEAGVTTTYSWNVRNQLTGIANTGFSASFTYDSFGRRTGKTIQGTTTNFVYDGLNPVQEKSGATVPANLLLGLGIDEFFTRTDGIGSRALLTDALGSTVALGDGSGTIQTQYTYEPFGYASQTGQANTNSYKYTGREDDGSGLYYYRARYYHPRPQRFIAEDPLGFDGGDANLYVYVGNSPPNFIDSTSEIVAVPLIAAGALVGGTVNTIIYAATTQQFSWQGALGSFVGGAAGGALGTVATPLSAVAGLGTGYGGAAVVNALAGVVGNAISAAFDPCQNITPSYLISSAGFSSLGGAVAQKFFPTVGMQVFGQVGFPRTWSAFIPQWAGGNAGRNANAITHGGIVAGAFGVFPNYFQTQAGNACGCK